jgi:hypothetical protein
MLLGALSLRWLKEHPSTQNAETVHGLIGAVRESNSKDSLLAKLSDVLLVAHLKAGQCRDHGRCVHPDR